MFYVLLALLLFSATVTAHVLFCRNSGKQGLLAKLFVNLAFIALGIYIASILTWSRLLALDPHSIWGLPFKMTAGVIFFLLVPMYLCFYVLTQLTSPSKKILSVIAQRQETGYDEILASVTEEDFIASRLKDLCDSKCVIRKDGRYVITSEGQKVAGILNTIQFILGRKVGG
jgi:hypothetical protein